MQWLLEQYGINHQVVSAQDFDNLAAEYDVIPCWCPASPGSASSPVST